MAHRDSDVTEQSRTNDITIRLVDMEPIAGLCAAVARFCGAMTPAAYAALPQDATEALATAQGILWRLEHANPEQVT